MKFVYMHLTEFETISAIFHSRYIYSFTWFTDHEDMFSPDLAHMLVAVSPYHNVSV